MSIEQDWKQLDGQENDELSSMLTELEAEK